MHTAIGALSTGSIEGALTTTSIAAAAPTLNQIQESMVKTLTDKEMKTDSAEAVVNGVSSFLLCKQNRRYLSRRVVVVHI